MASTKRRVKRPLKKKGANQVAPKKAAAAPPAWKLDVVAVHGASPDLGYLGSIVVDGDRVWAVGGTYSKPTILHSDDRGHSFVRWPSPQAPGIRDVHVDGDTVWVVGEWGLVAYTKDKGQTWTKINLGKSAAVVGSSCMYSIMPDSKGRFWLLGDNGMVLRMDPAAAMSGDGPEPKPKRKKVYTKVANESSARMLYMFVEEGDVIWLLDSGGMLQRSTKKGFEVIPLAAMRTPRPLCALVRTPKKTLILLGDGGLVLRSTNNGESWKKISVDSRNDLEKILVTQYGIFIVGSHGSLLVSHDDGKSFQGLTTNTGDNHLWSIAQIGGDLIIGGERGQVWRIERRELAEHLRVAYEKTDPIIAGLAGRVRDNDEAADLVLEDALRERELW